MTKLEKYKSMISERLYDQKTKSGLEYKITKYVGAKGSSHYFMVKFKTDPTKEQEVSLNVLAKNDFKNKYRSKLGTRRKNTYKNKEKKEVKLKNTFRNAIKLKSGYTSVTMDLSSQSSGVCVRKDGKIIYEDFIFMPKEVEPRVIYRARHMYDEFVKIVEKYKPDVVFVENVLEKSKRVLYSLTLVHSPILIYCINNDIPFRRCSVQSWKHALDISEYKERVKGKTEREKSKNATILWVKEKYGIDVVGDRNYTQLQKNHVVFEDRADAIAVSHYAENYLVEESG